MSNAQAKLFEWHRVQHAIERAGHELRETTRRADAGSVRRAQELMGELERLSTLSNELLAEIGRLRKASTKG
jgi:DNA polymerase/3'-5' exonuclease PolX